MKKLIVVVVAQALFGCGSAEVQYEEPGERPIEPARVATPEAPADVEEGAAPTTPDQDALKAQAKRERLAEKLLSGWVAFHPHRKVFAVVNTFTEEGAGTGVIATLSSEEDAYEAQDTLCEAGGGCDANAEKLSAATAEWIGKQKLEDAVALELVDFKPVAGFPTAELGSIAGKLVYKKDHFDVVRGFKATSLPKLEFAKEFKPTLAQATASPDGKLAVALFRMDPGENYAKGFNEHVDIKVFPVP